MGALVGRYGAALAQVKGKDVTASSTLQYSHAVNDFRRFAAANNVPTDIFMSDAVNVSYIVMCWTLDSRQQRHGRTTNPDEPVDAVGDKLYLPLTAKTLDQHVSALKHFVKQHGGNAAAIRCPELRTIIASFARQDDIVRGPSDFYIRYPLGAEFTWRVIQRIRATMPDRRVQLLYEVAATIEYTFGLRVMEALEKTRVAPDPYILPNVYLPDENPRYVALEKAAAIHTVRNQDLLLCWRAERTSCAAHDTHRGPARPPDYVVLFADHTKNWRAGPPPSSIHANPGGAHAAPFCLCATLYKWLRPQRTRAARDFLLSGAHDKVMRALVKDTATSEGMDPSRAVLAGWRRGCASATILNNDAKAAADALRQQFQHWRSAAGAAVYVEGQLDDGLVKTIQLYDMRSTNIAATRARFNRPHET